MQDGNVFAKNRKFLLPCLIVLALFGCKNNPGNFEDRQTYFVNRLEGAQAVNERVRFLVIHYTAQDEPTSIASLSGEFVSAHYLIPEQPAFQSGKPIVLQLVNEEKRAWHAGVSYWNGRTNLNDSSIGIEIVNSGYVDDERGVRHWTPYNDTQIAALSKLAEDIIQRYRIAPDNVVGHSDIAPLRKQDPGKLFPWKALAQQGIGAWPDQHTVDKYLAGRSPFMNGDIVIIQQALLLYGYAEMPQNGILDQKTRKIISAFQMHFRPDDIGGEADAETEAIACALVEKYRQDK
ncbi:MULTISPECIES: N-acetylmuramoyl-L-alanine amidase [Enterobacter cloacae complex]|uniref:N-acetylmuramoyl-L-alanine amidase n=1 Tax=Enterobacter cloacae complex TaxID=354276 RepID=UPI002970AE8D|nr:N-acetylmuramoyl-L-alanine amidase [Enterobacter roggenkampii]MEB6513685.1 N-acetylmuramoyl-L-alanine amidase [Enterobacter roggenkampii]HAS1172442.1 N-acetylmuramoyl-L-alanine amidase [Enterobacter cloacae]